MKYDANGQCSVLLLTMQLLMANSKCLCNKLHKGISTINFWWRNIEQWIAAISAQLPVQSALPSVA